jgi:hypothetical protein
MTEEDSVREEEAGAVDATESTIIAIGVETEAVQEEAGEEKSEG